MHDLANFLGKRLLIITAHPDDESFLAAGLLHANAKAGGTNLLICATLGENGKKYLYDNRKKNIKEIRHTELTAATKLLGITKCLVLDHQDGQIANEQTIFLQKIENLLKEYSEWQPDALISFDSTGLTGHHDHIAAHAIAKVIAEKYHLPLLCATPPPNPFQKEYLAALQKKRAHENYTDTPPELPTHRLAIDGNIKIAALKCHTSQWQGLDPYKIFPVHITEHFLQFEYFTLHLPNKV